MTTPTPPPDWFWRWVRAHTLLLAHQGWQAYRDNEPLRQAFFGGWWEHFEAKGIGPDLAMRATRALQARHPGFPEHHLEQLLAAAAAIRAAEEAEQHQRDLARRFEQHQRARLEIEDQRRRWREMTPAERKRWLSRATRRSPDLGRLPRVLETLAFSLFTEDQEHPNGELQETGQ